MTKPVKRCKPSAPAMMDTKNLRLQLTALAELVEDRRIQEMIYRAVRQLRSLDKAAREAGLLPLTEDHANA